MRYFTIDFLISENEKNIEILRSSQTFQNFKMSSRKLFFIHSHLPRTVCKTCDMNNRGQMPNGILCYLPVSKHQDHSNVTNVTLRVFKDSVTFSMIDNPMDVNFMNLFQEKGKQSISILQYLNPQSHGQSIKKPIAFENSGFECYSNAIISWELSIHLLPIFFKIHGFVFYVIL